MQNIIGHEAQKEYLHKIVSKGEVHHAFLFLGPSQVGKTAMAMWFAQLLFCLAPQKPCGSCPACLQVASLTHPDVMVLSKEADKKNISVEQVREMIQKMSQSSFLASWKVGIIVEAADLNTQASNALLKSLEEPTGKTVYIITSAREQRVLPTVKSRCVSMAFLPVAQAKIQAFLQEKGVAESALFAALSHGCPGFAMQSLQEEAKKCALDYLARLYSVVKQKELAQRFAAVDGLWPVKTTMNEQVGVAKALLDYWIRAYQIVLENPAIISSFGTQESLFVSLRGLTPKEICQGVDRILKTNVLLQENVNVKLALENLVLDL